MVSSRKSETIDAAVKAVEQEPKEVKEVTLSNGIVLKVKTIPTMALRYAITNVKRPEPPVVMNEEKGREEVWEGDPRYQEALLEYEERMTDATANVMFLLGTEIKSIPEGIDSNEDDGWLDSLKAAGIDVDVSSPAARYLNWMRYYAVGTPTDLAILTDAVARKSGLLDKDVSSAMQSFRGGEGRGTDLEDKDEKQRPDGNNLQSPNGGADIGS